MVSLATGAIVLAAALDTFNVIHAHALQQQRTVAHQQDLRMGLEVFEQETRLAVSDSIVTASPDEFLFLANISSLQTTTTSAVMAGQSILAVQDGSGWGDGKTVRLCGAQACETHRLSVTGQQHQLTLNEPVTMTLLAGASVEVSNRVSYYGKRDEQGSLRLMRMVDGGASVLIGELEGVRFSYWDEGGRPTDIPFRITRVAIELTTGDAFRKIRREISLRS